MQETHEKESQAGSARVWAHCNADARHLETLVRTAQHSVGEHLAGLYQEVVQVNPRVAARGRRSLGIERMWVEILGIAVFSKGGEKVGERLLPTGRRPDAPSAGVIEIPSSTSPGQG